MSSFYFLAIKVHISRLNGSFCLLFVKMLQLHDDVSMAHCKIII